MKYSIFIWILFILPIAFAFETSGGGISIRVVHSSGAVIDKSGDYQIKGSSLGQEIIGNSTKSDYTALFGFWYIYNTSNITSQNVTVAPVSEEEIKISLTNPPNSTTVNDGTPPDVTFRFYANSTVKNCTLYISNTRRGNDSTQMTHYNITVHDLDAGSYTWNVTCYDLNDNLIASGWHNLQISLITTGAMAQTSPAGSGGGLMYEPINVTKKAYNVNYLCRMVDEFVTLINRTTDLIPDIVILQEDIKFDTGIKVPLNTLRGYIENYDTICRINATQPAETVNKSLKDNIIDKLNISNILNFNPETYFTTPKINIGELKSYEDKDRLGLLNFLNSFFHLSLSDALTPNPNIIIDGIRLIPDINFKSYLPIPNLNLGQMGEPDNNKWGLYNSLFKLGLSDDSNNPNVLIKGIKLIPFLLICGIIGLTIYWKKTEHKRATKIIKMLMNSGYIKKKQNTPSDSE